VTFVTHDIETLDKGVTHSIRSASTPLARLPRRASSSSSSTGASISLPLVGDEIVEGLVEIHDNM
jgi:hypothetical protein